MPTVKFTCSSTSSCLKKSFSKSVKQLVDLSNNIRRLDFYMLRTARVFIGKIRNEKTINRKILEEHASAIKLVHSLARESYICSEAGS